MNNKGLELWSSTMFLVLSILLCIMIYLTFNQNNLGMMFAVMIGSFLGISFILLDYHFKKAPLSSDINDKKKVKKGVGFKKIQKWIMMFILSMAALISISIDLIIPQKSSIENPGIIFVVFFFIKEIYEYNSEAKDIINASQEKLDTIVD